MESARFSKGRRGTAKENFKGMTAKNERFVHARTSPDLFDQEKTSQLGNSRGEKSSPGS